MVTSINSLSIRRGARREIRAKRVPSPWGCKRSDGGRNRTVFAAEESYLLSSCRADSKVGVKHIYHASNNV